MQHTAIGDHMKKFVKIKLQKAEISLRLTESHLWAMPTLMESLLLLLMVNVKQIYNKIQGHFKDKIRKSKEKYEPLKMNQVSHWVHIARLWTFQLKPL